MQKKVRQEEQIKYRSKLGKALLFVASIWIRVCRRQGRIGVFEKSSGIGFVFKDSVS